MEMSPETLMRPLALVTGGDVSKAHYHNGGAVTQGTSVGIVKLLYYLLVLHPLLHPLR
jgi:hypothetical protein